VQSEQLLIHTCDNGAIANCSGCRLELGVNNEQVIDPNAFVVVFVVHR